MKRLLRAFFYKISKDITFRITLIVGGGLAVLMTLLYFAIDRFAGEGFKMLCGQSMLISSFSPMQNFGISIPINIISFVILEFSQGTVRNKIIAGHSKIKIYTSLFISGLVLGLSLLLVYVLACTALGSIFGGFNINEVALLGNTGASGKLTVEFIIKFVILGILAYTSIVAFAVFISTAFRSMGPSIPLVFVGIIALSMLAMLLGIALLIQEATVSGVQSDIVDVYKEMASEGVTEERIEQLNQLLPTLEQELVNQQATLDTYNNVCNVVKCIDPLYGISTIHTVDGVAVIDDFTFYGGIGSNIAYSAVFFISGACLFKKRDIK